MEIGTFTTENEIFPGWDSLHHDSRVVPARAWVIDVGIRPLMRIKVKQLDFVVDSFVVPATIGKEFVVHNEDRMATTPWWWGLSTDLNFNLLPLFGLDVKCVDVIQADALVVETTMTTIDEDLVLV